MKNEKTEWTKELTQKKIAWPAEYVIRIFKGTYPRLNLAKEKFQTQNICDLGCGDGRNIVLLNQVGFMELYGMEITQEIVKQVEKNLSELNIRADIRMGFNHSIPFEDCFFDYVLSWNQCYYMGDHEDFNNYVKEFTRILKKDGFLILSIPKKTCFIYKDSEKWRKGYQIIRNDPYHIRNGAILREFEDVREIKETFSPFFDRFIVASVEDDCFGYNYHWHLIVCQKK